MTISELTRNMRRLAMMVLAVIAFAACNSDGDNDGDNGGLGKNSVTLHLDEAGTLSEKLTKEQAAEVLRLKLTGHMDARDFDFIKWDCMKVEEVDLSGIVIDAYSGLLGTMEGKEATYAANEIPAGAFFYWKDTHKYVYDGMPADEGMASLKKIVLPEGITAIRRNAFARAYNLKEINIPEGVEAIDFVAFNICTSLEELTLPSTLRTVGQWAFGNMTSLKKLYVKAMTPPTASNNTFEGKPWDAHLYVPADTRTAYRNAAGWNYFSPVIEVGGDGTTYTKENVVGTWVVASYECSIQTESVIGSKLYFKADGTYKDPGGTGHWELDTERELTIAYDDGGNQRVYKVVYLSKNSMALQLLNMPFSFTMYLNREGTNGDNNHGGNDNEDNNGTGVPSTGDFIQVTLNGKTYTGTIYDNIYAQIDPVGRDSENKPLTLTYDMFDHFSEKGFEFFHGIVHYSRKADLLTTKPGTYECGKDILTQKYYHNMNFWSTLSIDYEDYDWVSGTHTLKSIKEVNGHVQLEGSYTSTFEHDGKTVTVKGKYRMTIP